jgi:ribosomal protein S27AE
MNGLIKMNDELLNEINKFRYHEKLPIISKKERKCLKCEKSFVSIGGNRICGKCKLNETPYMDNTYAVKGG